MLSVNKLASRAELRRKETFWLIFVRIPPAFAFIAAAQTNAAARIVFLVGFHLTLFR